jgi:hypothetical protein
MKILLLAAVAALGFSTATAFAEGAGNPFPFRTPGKTITTGGMKQLPPGLDNPYPFSAPGDTVSLSNYKQLPPGLDNPYPFAAPGQVYTVQSNNGGRSAVATVVPARPTTVVR